MLYWHPGSTLSLSRPLTGACHRSFTNGYRWAMSASSACHASKQGEMKLRFGWLTGYLDGWLADLVICLAGLPLRPPPGFHAGTVVHDQGLMCFFNRGREWRRSRCPEMNRDWSPPATWAAPLALRGPAELSCSLVALTSASRAHPSQAGQAAFASSSPPPSGGQARGCLGLGRARTHQRSVMEGWIH